MFERFILSYRELNDIKNTFLTSLLVRRAKNIVSSGMLLAHARMLKTTAKYPLTKIEVKTFTIHAAMRGIDKQYNTRTAAE